MVGKGKRIVSMLFPLGRAILSRKSTKRMIFNSIRLNRAEVSDLLLDEDLRFIAYCMARRARSRSQIMQDLWVGYELGEKRNGYFVEFGATNGLKNSNTWYLEKEMGWSGILAEPNPFWHRDLAASRNAHIEHKCVSSESGKMVSFITTNDVDPELSGIADFADGDHWAETRDRGTRIQVETISLDDLLDKYDAPASIDYMSIDTEGSELDILSSYSFRHQFQVLSVESNPRNEAALCELLTNKGYARVFETFSQWDSWYVAKELRERQPGVIVAPEA
jgi:FkbM family methyltransferase